MYMKYPTHARILERRPSPETGPLTMLLLRAIAPYLGVFVSLITLYGCSSNDDDDRLVAASPVPNPIVTQASGGLGQVPGGLRYDVAQFGYKEQEFFFEGEAKTFPPFNLPPARYLTRMIVWTPADPAHFNGTTIVEWAHVSDFGQFELTVEINFQSPMLEEEGFAFVLVSAEEGGVCDQSSNGCTATSLKGVDPGRYGMLNHPGDPYSFDIFNQALQAIKYPSGTAPLGELSTDFIIVEGFQPSIDKWFPVGIPNPTSTSPFSVYGPLNAYLASGADEDAQLADAFLIDAAAPATAPDSYRVPTLHHLDESAIRRVPTPDSSNHVTWEITGAPHTDRWMADHIRIPSSQGRAKLTREEEAARRDQFDDFAQAGAPGGEICAANRAEGSMFPRRYTLNAALLALHHWIVNGVPAPAMPRIERVLEVPETPTTKLARNVDGNAIGGVQLPIVQSPVATYNGEACVQAGTTTMLSPERLASLYPTHQSYVEQLLSETNAAVESRILLCRDARTIMRKVSMSTMGGTDEFIAEPDCARKLD